MPFISTKVSVPISEEKEQILKAKFGKAIESFPGKSEAYLMLEFQDNCRLWFRGEHTEPIAWIQIDLLGKGSRPAFDAMTKEVTNIISEELGIPAGNIYVKYQEIDVWGCNGRNF